MLSLFYTIVALENHDFELVRLVKRQNEDITLHCSLSENHEVSKFYDKVMGSDYV